MLHVPRRRHVRGLHRVNAAVEKAMAATATAAPPPPGDSEFARQASC